jgi:hypothetical protein
VSKVFKSRYTAAIEGDFAVFLIGMRLNQPWKVWEWWPVFMAMPRMLRELYEHPELGFLGTEYFLSFANRAPMLVQYWRSFEDLEAYARGKGHAHLPAWQAFNRKLAKSGSVGIFHETYVVAAGRSESVYANMPRFGLARAAEHVPATGKRETARQRLTS